MLLLCCLIFFIGTSSVSSSFANHSMIRLRRDTKCSITEEELKSLRELIVELNSEASSSADISGCGEILTETIVSAGNLKSFLAKKLESIEKGYNETKHELIEQENELLSKLEMIPKAILDRYTKNIEATTKKIVQLQKVIDGLKLENENYQEDINYYEDVLKNGTKYSTRFDDDSFFENAKICTFSNDKVSQLIRELNEIFLLVVGNSKVSNQDNCFEEIRNQIGNIDIIITHKSRNDVIESLKKTYAERSKILQTLIDSYTMASHQSGKQNLSDTLDILQEMKLDEITLKSENDVLKKEATIKGIQTVKMMIRSGARFRKARDIFLKIRNKFPNMLETVLDISYDCDINFLPHVLTFAESNSKLNSFVVIKDKMKECDHLSSPLILYVAYVTNDKDLDPSVTKVYEGWISQFKKGKYDQVKEFLNKVDTKIINFRKFFTFAMSTNTNNLKLLLNFISELHAFQQDIISDLYDQIEEQNLVSSNEHIQIARWVHDKLVWINQKSSQVYIGNLQIHLEAIKEKLPKGIKIFIFDPSVILSTKEFEYLMRSDNHIGVKFKVMPHTSQIYYRFEDLRFGKAFYAEMYTDDKSKSSSMRVRLGNAYSDNYYWSVIPTDNAKFFYIKNKSNGYFLSSEEDNVCKNYGWVWGCTVREWMNRAQPNNSFSSTEWMFTDVLIRNGILPDRNQG